MSETLDEKTVRHVAKLSRLELTDEQVQIMASQLSAVLAYVDKLSELDVDGVEPMAHAMEMSNRLREDVPVQNMTAAQAIENAPSKTPPFFRVPKVLGDGGSA